MGGASGRRSIVRAGLAAACVLLSSCTPAAMAPEAARALSSQALPEARRFTGPPAATPVPPAARLAQDFMDLSFMLESGRALPVFSRFEGSVTIGVEGAAPPTLGPDLDALIARLRGEAGIDVSRARPGERASITVTALPRAELQAQVPGAACFVVPRVSTWDEYLANRRGPATDWATVTERSRAAVFVPADVSPQEIRDCLHEEIGQALGPLNDLYRLPHSVFNDDNVHVVLTSADMAILRAAYDPALRSGMTPEAVAERLPAILARQGLPGGAGERARPDSDAWLRAIRGALSAGGSARARIGSAEEAVRLAQAEGWRDERLAFSLLSLGRAALNRRPEVALMAFLDAGQLYRGLQGNGVHAAQVSVQLAAFAVSAGQGEAALAIVDDAIPAAAGAQNAALLATLLLLRAEALDIAGARTEAGLVRREGLAWGRYGWGEEALARRAAEVAALAPSV